MLSAITNVRSAVLLALLVIAAAALAARPGDAGVGEDGVVKVRSAYDFAETIERLKQDIAGKGIMFFTAVDQSALAADAEIKLRPSTLLIFGNPGLGAHFMTSNPIAGLDWPVRLLVIEDAAGQVWAVYTDFGYIQRRHRITDRNPQFEMASQVIASITSSVAAN